MQKFAKKKREQIALVSLFLTILYKHVVFHAGPLGCLATLSVLHPGAVRSTGPA